MAAGAAPGLEPQEDKNESELTHPKPTSFKEWLARKLDKLFEHNHEHDTYPGL